MDKTAFRMARGLLTIVGFGDLDHLRSLQHPDHLHPKESLKHPQAGSHTHMIMSPYNMDVVALVQKGFPHLQGFEVEVVALFKDRPLHLEGLNIALTFKRPTPLGL